MIQFNPHLFFNPVSKKISTPPPRLSTPHLKKNFDPPPLFGQFEHWVAHTYTHTRTHLAIMQRRAFSIVGPSAWNDLPFELRSVLMAHPSKFYISLKSFFFGHGWAGSASE